MTVLLEYIKTLVSQPSLVVAVTLAAVTLYVVLVIAYRLTVHPLAKYPGPVLAKVTDLYLAYHAWKGDRHLEFWRCHEKYGSVVRLGPNLLSFNTNTALKQIYGFKANVRKADFYTAFPANKHTFNVHSAIDKQVHGRKRRVISHAFADNAIKSMEKYIVANIDVACDLISDDVRRGQQHEDEQTSLWSPMQEQQEKQCLQHESASKGWSTPRNMANWADWLTFDIMGDLVFGKAFGMLEAPSNRFAVDLVSNAARRHLICGTALFIHKWHLDKIFFRKIAAKRQQYMAYSRAQAMERTKVGTKDCDRKDFFYHLLNARDPETGRGFSGDELWGESNLFIIAGSDTTSTALASTLFYIAHNRAALDRATREVRATFASTAEIASGAQLQSCAFLRACIDESMRLAPPVAGALPRAVLPGGLVVADHRIPTGTDVCVPHYALHHNAEYFAIPFMFRPERWLADENDAASLELVRSAFAPFSVGPRGCIGKGMAYLELSLSLARLLWEYDVRVAPNSAALHGQDGSNHLEYQLKDTFTSIKDGPVLQFRRKADS